jgi:hypothetical protein
MADRGRERARLAGGGTTRPADIERLVNAASQKDALLVLLHSSPVTRNRLN